MAAAAYRAGAELVDERTGVIHNFTRKSGVVSTEILLPDGGSVERNFLWNSAEAAEKRKDARTAREWIVALPSELDADERAELAVTFGRELVSRYGVAVDVAIHMPDREGDNRNHHAHVLTTTRQVGRGQDGELVLGEKATIELSDKRRRELGLGPAADEVKAVRELWEQTANRALERAGRAERIDARSLAAQGIHREATTHLGPIATQMERRGVASDRGDQNRIAVAANDERYELQRQFDQVSAEIIDLEKARGAKRARGSLKPGPARHPLRRVPGETRQMREIREWAELVVAALMKLLGLSDAPDAAQVRQEIARRRSPPVDPRAAGAVLEAQARLQLIEVKLAKVEKRNSPLNGDVAKYRDFVAQDERVAAWREAHPYKARLHDLGLARTDEAEFCGHDLEAARGRIGQLQKELREEFATLGKAKEKQVAYLAELQEQAAVRALASSAPEVAELVEQLEAHAEVLEAYERALAEAKCAPHPLGLADDQDEASIKNSP